MDLARERLRGGQVAWGFPGDLPVLGAQRALSVPDPQRAQATRTAVGTTPRTPSTRASGLFSFSLLYFQVALMPGAKTREM